MPWGISHTIGLLLFLHNNPIQVDYLKTSKKVSWHAFFTEVFVSTVYTQKSYRRSPMDLITFQYVVSTIFLITSSDVIGASLDLG